MPRNRRNSSVSSYKSTIGFSLLKLFLVTTIVAQCVLKVILGGEYISDCPSEPLLPVYLVISGCLPVFLSPLRGSNTTDYSQYGDKFCRLSTYNKAVLSFGIIANLAWLILGTVLLTTLVITGKSFSSDCLISGTNNQTPDLLLSSTLNNETDMTARLAKINQSQNNVDVKDLGLEGRTTSEGEHESTMIFTTEAIIINSAINSTSEKVDTTPRPFNKTINSTSERVDATPKPFNKTINSTSERVDATPKPFNKTINPTSERVDATPKPFNNTKLHEDIWTLKTENQPKAPKLTTKLHKIEDSNLTQQTSLIDEPLNAPDTSGCVACSQRLITFTLVTASIDWILVIFAIILLTVVICCRMPSFKELVPFLGSV